MNFFLLHHHEIKRTGRKQLQLSRKWGKREREREIEGERERGRHIDRQKKEGEKMFEQLNSCV